MIFFIFYEKIYFLRAFGFGKIARFILQDKLLHDILFGERTFELCKYDIAIDNGGCLQPRHRPQQSDIQEKNLEGSSILIAFQWDSWSLDVIYLIYKPSIQ